MAQTSQPLLSLQNISRHYPSGEEVVRALDGVSLDIFAGEFVAIMGQSGSGKTTLMNMIGCLDRPTSGAYLVEGRDVSSLTRDEQAKLRSRTFGFIYQRYNLLETASAQENVELPAIYAGVKKEERGHLAAALLEKLGLGDRLKNRPNALSGGQQQRVAIARALVNNPAIVLADEPTGALDSRSGEEVMALLKSLNEEGRTIILITHDEKVASHAHRQIRIADGRIVSDEKSGAAKDEETKRDARLRGQDEKKKEQAEPITEIGEAVKMAVRALRVNKFRTFLTLLGIIIGVASVIVMLAVGAGSKQKVLDQITAMGTNLIMVRPGAPGIRPSGSIATLVIGDAEAIAELPNVGAVVPERSGQFTIRRGQVDATTTVIGTNENMVAVNNWEIASGSGITKDDYKRMMPVALIGQTVRANLFPNGEDPIGKTIMVKNILFEVIGVLKSKGGNMFGRDQDDVVYIPYTTGAVRLFGRPFLSNITAQAMDLSLIEETQKNIEMLLLDRHRVEDFAVRNMASFIEMASETQNTLTILLGAVAAISLLVGGIGVMNIMLVSVTERTREIGVRMATGARGKDIMLQFMTEAVVVCLAGGIAGVILGIIVALIVNAFGMRTVLTLAPMALAFTCAVSTGLVFGLLPARKASRLDPVVALASE